MKTKQILWVITATFIVGAIFVAGTIRSDAQTSSVIEKRIGNTVYELDTLGYVLKNKSNEITGMKGFSIVSIDKSEHARKAWVKHFKPLFSKERAKELLTRINLNCFCDSTGLVRDVVMFFGSRENFEMFTSSEIKAIEDAAKKYRFNILAGRGDIEDRYVYVGYPFSLLFTPKKVPVIKKKKKIGNTVYELDTSNYTLKNKKNKISEQEVTGEVFVDNSEQAQNAWEEQFKPIFSKDRAKELYLRITLINICDSTGQIQEVSILFRTREIFEMFTLSEIKAIEDAAKKYRYNFTTRRVGERFKYARIWHPLNPYLLYFEKPTGDLLVPKEKVSSSSKF